MHKIPLTQGQVALIDEEDFEKISRHKWYAQWDKHTKGYYANTQIKKGEKRKHLSMHRLIMGLDVGDKRQVDHINHDTLDNRKANLRVCNISQNGMNRRKRKDSTSGFKGVAWRKDKQKWHVQIWKNGTNRFLGYFDDLIEAAKAYDQAALEHFGEFAELNFPLNDALEPD